MTKHNGVCLHRQNWLNWIRTALTTGKEIGFLRENLEKLARYAKECKECGRLERDVLTEITRLKIIQERGVI